MPHPSWPSERAPVPSKRNTGYRNEGAGVVHDETERRKDEATIAAAAQQPSGGGGGGTATVPRPPPPPEAPKPGPDRLHKRAVSKDWGGYVYVSHDHDDASEDSELPPTNPAYRGAGVVASSIADAYAYAATRMSTMRAGSRVAIVPIAGRWSEAPLTIAITGIDIIGHGRPSLDMGIFVGGMGDASFETLDMRTTGDAIPLTLQPTAPQPGVALPRVPTLTGCRLYAEGRALVALQQFEASDSTFEQTSSVYGLDEAHAVVDVQFQPPWPGVALMRGCTLRSWTTLPDMVSSPAIGIVPLDGHPGGYAIRAVATAAGPFGVNDIDGALSFEWPSNQVVLDDCAVYGSAFVDQWQLEHIGGHVHGSVPIGVRSGTIYAVLRGRPLFNPAFYANVPGHVMFDGTRIFAEEIAKGLPFNGAYPPGVTPSNFPGLVYVQASGGSHFGRWDGGAASAFHPIGGAGPIGVFDVANISTWAAAWTSGGWLPGTVSGACPVNVPANRRFYLM